MELGGYYRNKTTLLIFKTKNYEEFFDYNYVVVGSKHAKHIKEHVPEWWGIISVELIEETVDFYVIREATINKKCNRKKKLGLLWRPELAHIQEINGMPKYKEKSKAFVIDKILTKIPEELLSEQISQELFERDYNEIENTIKAYKAERKTRKKANPS